MLIVVIITGLLLLGFLCYGLYLYKYKKNRFAEQKSIIEFTSIFISIFFAVLTVYQTSESIKSSQEDSTNLIKKIDTIITSANNAKSILDSVSSKLAPLPSQLSEFSKSVSTLNTVIKSQQKRFVDNISNLEGSVGGLTSSLKDYRGYINDYSGQLKNIVTQTESQLKIWKDQQELVKKEYDRRPILYLTINEKSENDSTVNLESVNIVNDGNIKADIYSVVIMIPQKYEIKIDNSIKPMWEFWKTEKEYKYYQLKDPQYLNITVSSGTRTVVQLGLFGYNKKTSPSLLYYSIFYESKYKDGVERGELRLY